MSPRRWLVGLPIVLLPFLGACATTSHDPGAPETTWRRQGSSLPTASTTEPLPVYVARFGLADSVAAEHPGLREAGVGLGLGSYVADGLWESGRFRFLEEKAQMASRLEELGERIERVEPRVPSEAEHVLYGEIVEITTRRSERVAGLSGKAEETIEVTVQLRLVNRKTREVVQATESGHAMVAVRSAGERLEPRAVGDATEDAVRRAAQALLERLGGRG